MSIAEFHRRVAELFPGQSFKVGVDVFTSGDGSQRISWSAWRSQPWASSGDCDTAEEALRVLSVASGKAIGDIGEPPVAKEAEAT